MLCWSCHYTKNERLETVLKAANDSNVMQCTIFNDLKIESIISRFSRAVKIDKLPSQHCHAAVVKDFFRYVHDFAADEQTHWQRLWNMFHKEQTLNYPLNEFQSISTIISNSSKLRKTVKSTPSNAAIVAPIITIQLSAKYST